MAATASAGARRGAAKGPSKGRARFELRWRGILRGDSRLESLYPIEALERVELVKAGVPARLLERLSADMGVPKVRLYRMLGLARTTVERKVSARAALNQDESERVLGFARLVGQVETVVRESGEARGFDAAKWAASWLERPQSALGGKRPADLMDTADGRGIVSDLIARMQSGAYT